MKTLVAIVIVFWYLLPYVAHSTCIESVQKDSQHTNLVGRITLTSSGESQGGGFSTNPLKFGRRRINRELYTTLADGIQLARIILFNASNVPITISKVRMEKHKRGDYFVMDLNNLLGTIVPGDSLVMPVGFEPGSVGEFFIQLSILTDQSDQEGIIDVFGTGIAPKISITPLLDFGIQTQMKEMSIIKVTNPGLSDWQFGDTLRLISFDCIEPDGIVFKENMFGNTGFSFPLNKLKLPLPIPPGGSLYFEAYSFNVDKSNASATMTTVSDAIEEATCIWRRGDFTNDVGDAVTGEVDCSIYSLMHNNYVLKFTTTNSTSVVCDIVNSNGAIIKNVLQTTQFGVGQHQIDFTVDECAAGLYFIRLQCGSAITTLPITVIR